MSDRPNILVLMTDQHRADAMSCAGNPILRTPAMDAIAASGVRFTNACAATPVCVASRMAFITGHRAAHTHWVDNSALPGPQPELPSLMSLLLRAGYWTQGVGKMHFRGRSYGFRKLLTMEEGVAHRIDDDYLRYLRDVGVQARFPKGIRDLLYFQPQTSGVPVEHSASNWVADRSIEFLHEHARYRPDQPFFLWSSWIAPHPPFAPSEPYDELYDPVAMPLPEYADRPLHDLPSALWPHRARLDGAHRDPDRMRRIRALYYGLIGQIDDGIARIMAALRELRPEQNTVVLFTADHGEMLGDHGLSQKNCPYEASVRVPLLLRWPGRTLAGTTCDDPVGLTDVLPTLVAELGLDYPVGRRPLPGESLVGVPGGGLASGRGDYVIDYGQGPRRWIAVRTRYHKYALFACDGGREELYDLRTDPHERTNLAATQPELAAALRERALEWERNQGLAQAAGEAASFRDGRFRTFPAPTGIPSEEELCEVVVNEGAWPKRVPADEAVTLESFANAFTRAISKESTLTPDKLSVASYKRKLARLGARDSGAESLVGTPWEQAWRDA